VCVWCVSGVCVCGHDEPLGKASIVGINDNKHENVYGAVIVAQSHCESSSGSYDEYGTAPSDRRPSVKAKRPGL